MAEKGIPLEVVIQMEDATETDKKLASDAVTEGTDGDD